MENQASMCLINHETRDVTIPISRPVPILRSINTVVMPGTQIRTVYGVFSGRSNMRPYFGTIRV